MKEIVIDNVIYVAKEKEEVNNKKPYVIIRTYSAGVHAGYLEEKNGMEVVLSNARRIWYWEGAATLSELAMRGTSKPTECKFPMPVSKIILEAIEIIETTKKAQESIEGVAEWTAH